jgi:transcriptional regulator with XRE-family HTH domain
MDYELLDKKARGKRLRQLRRVTDLEQSEFAEKYAINPVTYRDWESATRNSIPEAKARKLIERLKYDGIVVTIEWLLFGVGMAPYCISSKRVREIVQAGASLEIFLNEDQAIKEELALFMLQNDAVSLEIADNVMLPCYKTGDLVAGIKRYGSHIEKLVGCDCIVTYANSLLLRRLERGKEKHAFTLLTLNPNATIEAVVYDVPIISAAPVLWLRRRLF